MKSENKPWINSNFYDTETSHVGATARGWGGEMQDAGQPHQSGGKEMSKQSFIQFFKSIYNFSEKCQ